MYIYPCKDYMVKKFFVCFTCLFCLLSSVLSQNNDSIRQENKQIVLLESVDTIRIKEDVLVLDKAAEELMNPKEPFKPNSKRATIYAAIFPGLGQFYNRKYWKLPIVYGGVLGFSYAISWNGGYYKDYSNAYKLIMREDWEDHFDEIKPVLPGGADIEYVKERLADQRNRIKRGRDFYRRNRDLSIIGGLAFYALTIIDAYVDAKLFDFNISPDLSMKVQPAIGLNPHMGKSVGVQCSFQF